MDRQTARRTGLLGVIGVLLLVVATLAPAADASRSSHSGPGRQGASNRASNRVSSWASASAATITPGVMMYTAGAQCTSNFVFTDARGRVYVGYAAHCAGTGSETATNGCHAGSAPLGTKVSFVKGGSLAGGGTRLGTGTLAYSSWVTEHRLGTRDPNTCSYNDLALVKVAAKDERKVNPSVPFWGGPTGLDTDGTASGDRLWTYGNSSLRSGLAVLSPHVGISLGDQGGGWSHQLYSVSPGVPGDSGSGFMTKGGKAVGVLSTIGLAPMPASNNIGDLAKELAFARAHSGLRGLRLTAGTVKFHGIVP